MNAIESQSTDFSAQFRLVGADLLQVFGAHGVPSRLVVSRTESMPYFSALPPEAQKAALRRLEMMLNLCKQTAASGASLASPSAILETFFQNTGLSSIEGLFENVQEEDSIEYYDTQHQLVFANLRIFQVVDYTLEDIFSRPWTDLLAREVPELDQKLLSLGNEMLTGKRTKLTSTAVIPDHICYEKDSPSKQAYRIIPNFFAPVYYSGATAGYLCSNHLELVVK